jgi:transaldolase
MASLTELFHHGQSMWLDNISRDLITGGGLQRLVDMGLRGVTSNPTIFHKAVTGSHAYDAELEEMIRTDPRVDEYALYEALTIRDVQMAADILRPVYDATAGYDGYVSLEVSPHLARDTKRTIERVQRLWKQVDRDNVMIKVPGTREGIPAVERLIAAGININVTLLFSVSRYGEVARAYLRGLAQAKHPENVASVASFFISRVDTKLDPVLERMGTPQALALRGKVAIANAKIAYQRFKEIFFDDQAFEILRRRGARAQRLLWGSTSTKDPAYRDVMYVEELIGPQTVNTVPDGTLDAFLAHGAARLSLEEAVDEAHRTIEVLATLGIYYDTVMDELEAEGIEKFNASYDQLLEGLRLRLIQTQGRPVGAGLR